MAATILLASGHHFDLSAPEDSSFTVGDIAHGLSLICRFGGQCSRPYSVAQHSVFVSRIVPEQHAYEALMHDAAEAFIGDIAKPIKNICPEFQALERRVEAAIFPRLGVPLLMSPEVKRADMIALATEQHQLMPDRFGRSFAGGHSPLDIKLPAMTWEEARAAFLYRYAELRQ